MERCFIALCFTIGGPGEYIVFDFVRPFDKYMKGSWAW